MTVGEPDREQVALPVYEYRTGLLDALSAAAGSITKLWQSEELPAWNALYRSDGLAREAQIDKFAPGGLLLSH